MKKQNIRARRNTSSKPASAQAPNKSDTPPGRAESSAKPWWDDNILQCLILGREGVGEECIWALPNGTLYLWDGTLSIEPRKITFHIALDWWQRHHDPRTDFAAPYFEEDTAAARLVSVACERWQIRNFLVTALMDQLEAANKTLKELRSIS